VNDNAIPLGKIHLGGVERRDKEALQAELFILEIDTVRAMQSKKKNDKKKGGGGKSGKEKSSGKDYSDFYRRL